MDDALAQIKSYERNEQFHVLILVVMDDALALMDLVFILFF